ncbi:MAG: ABC transporter permease [Celeribacter sp.]|jgi:putative hydroxymethylpyrimidine transport system permease protein
MRLIHLIAPALLALGLWQAAVILLDMPSFILPAPAAVALRLWVSRALIAEHALVTLTEVLAGLALGAGLGWVSAVVLASSARLRRLVQPLLVFSQAVPVFALAPILTLWFGYGLLSKIAMALLIIYFPVTSAFLDALLRTPPDWLAQAQVMGATRWRLMWRVRIPAALPGFLTGLKLAVVYAPIGAVIGEWVGASRGLGYLMLLANGRARIDLMFAALLTLAVMTVLLHWLADRAIARILARRDA